MLTQKTFTLLLFGSLGLNLFLAGVISSHLLHESSRVKRAHHGHASKDDGARAPAKLHKLGPKPEEARREGPEGRDHRTDRHPRAEHRGPRHRGPDLAGGSADLMLMRRMVRIMGGPEDPRIKRLREEKKGDIERMRNDIHAAHERVRLALAAEGENQEELSEALKHLRKTTFEAQARAQKGIVMLAGMMTPDERKKLRDSAPPGKTDTVGPKAPGRKNER